MRVTEVASNTTRSFTGVAFDWYSYRQILEERHIVGLVRRFAKSIWIETQCGVATRFFRHFHVSLPELCQLPFFQDFPLTLLRFGGFISSFKHFSRPNESP